MGVCLSVRCDSNLCGWYILMMDQPHTYIYAQYTDNETEQDIEKPLPDLSTLKQKESFCGKGREGTEASAKASHNQKTGRVVYAVFHTVAIEYA